MKRVAKSFSAFDMIDAFQQKIAELEGETVVTSAKWLDKYGNAFGEPGATYSDEDMKEFWDSDHEYDESMRAFDSYQEWYKATTEFLEKVEGSTRVRFRRTPTSNMSRKAVNSATELSAVEDTSNIYMLMYYLGGTEGMESDSFDCECMFKAADLDDAKAQVADWEGSRVSYYNEDEEPEPTHAGQYYADYFNTYFVPHTDGVVYNSLDEWERSAHHNVYAADSLDDSADTFRVYEINKPTGERKPLAGGSDFVSLYYAKLAAGSARAFEIEQNGVCDYSFEIECISNDEVKYIVTASTAVTANRDDHYFGEVMSKRYGQQICDALTGKTVSKRRDLAEEPGGLVYEANQLGIGPYDLLEALEGMCADGRASEIDDSTYRIRGGQPHPVRSLFGSTQVNSDELLEIAERYNTSKPVSGSWEHEIEHEQNAIAEHFGISLEDAKQVMIEQLGFSEDDFLPYYLRDTDRWVEEMEQYAEENPSGNGWEQMASKQVPDSNGFMTEYTLYRNTLDDTYACVFGDRDLYRPEEGYFDWEGDSEDEAWEWYNCYNGFADDDIMSATVVGGSVQQTSENIAEWISEHDQAYEDAIHFFGTDDLANFPASELMAWISDHVTLAEDFVAKFGPIPE